MYKPKLILHIGHSKTGTTTIQNFCVRNHDALLQLGYLYPIKASPRPNHILLPAGFLKPEYLRVRPDQVYRGKVGWFIQEYQRFINSLISDIELYRPHTVILSAEQLFEDYSGKSKKGLSDFLSDYFSEVKVVVYVRSFVKDYLSRISQYIRTGILSIQPKVRDLRAVLEYYEAQFPGQLEVQPFEHRQLVDGDVLHDFLANYVPEAASLLKDYRYKSANMALPWGLLQALRQIRLDVQPEGDMPKLQTRMLITMLKREYLSSNSKVQHSVKLKQEIEQQLWAMASDYLWLRNHYGIVFKDLDYSLLPIESVQVKKYEKTIKLEDIVDLNSEDIPRPRYDWYLNRGIKYYLNYSLFIVHLHKKRILNLYFRKQILLVRKIIDRYR